MPFLPLLAGVALACGAARPPAAACVDSTYRALFDGGRPFAAFVAQAQQRKAEWERHAAQAAFPDALVARAELALREGDVLGALKVLDRLPPKGREAVAVWREGAERRAAIDREVAALRARALRDLDPGVAASPGAAL